MGILQRGIEGWLGDATAVAVIGVEGPEGVLAAAPIALGLEAAGLRVTLIEQTDGGGGLQTIPPDEHSWGGAVAEWYGEQDRPVTVARWGGDAAALPAGKRIAAGGVALLDPPPALRARLELLRGRGALAAVTALGAERALGAPVERAEGRLAALVAVGAVVGVEAIGRFETAGRHFVELVEHVHHRGGPTRQSVTADTLRASLFGRHGDLPVSLATRDRPPRVGVLATLTWWVDLDELLEASA